MEPQDSTLSASEGTSLLPAFDYDPRTRVVFEAGAIGRVGEFAKELGGSRVLLVTDKGLAKAGHEDRCREALAAENLTVFAYDDVHPNPTTADVDRCLEFARSNRVDLIVGLGGGSSMDCAKGVNFLLTNGGKMQDYWGVGKATKPMLPMIAIPTTAGTGSEAQSFALIANADTHMKMACGDKKAACRVAVLDPELTVSMPRSVAAATGIDAISHAVETFVTKPRNVVSQLFSRRSWGLLSKGFPGIFETPDDISARGLMLVGAHLAGAAIENSMLGAAHALANPLTAHFNTTHGLAVGVMLPHVIRFNAEVVGNLYGKLAVDAGLCESENDPNAGNLLAKFITQTIRAVGAPTCLAECGLDEKLIPTLAQEAAKQWTANFNPRPVTAESLEELYRCAITND